MCKVGRTAVLLGGRGWSWDAGLDGISSGFSRGNILVHGFPGLGFRVFIAFPGR